MFYFFGSIVAWQFFCSISQIENFANLILMNKFFLMRMSTLRLDSFFNGFSFGLDSILLNASLSFFSAACYSIVSFCPDFLFQQKSCFGFVRFILSTVNFILNNDT